ncbi:MAG: TonB-dependent receptor plug domain-containing protein [Bacteroidales bacterium]|nr:TonB-dependent receptor plug domain-containing protein [Bacteroidales bacterium]
MKIKYIFMILLMQMVIQNNYAQEVIILTDSTEVPELHLEEIQISSSKNNLTLKKMPATVNMVSSKTISENEVQSLNDLTAIAPGFFMPDYGSKLTSPVYIRGIGSRINSPSVGLYVDHVPYFEKAAYDFDFFDVERIEILKGPQGTLYGRNAMGGIINVITRSPLHYQGTRMILSAGNYGNIAANLGHYNKAGENFGYSISMNYSYRDGFYTNSFLNDQVDKAHSFGLRNKLTWKITDRLRVEHIVSFEESREGGYPYAILNDSLMIPNDINYNQPSSYNRSLFSDALVVNFSGDNVELVATTAYQYLDDQQNIDQDFTPDSAYFVVQEQRQHMISQELIIRSPSHKRYNWLFGAYGFMQRFDKHVDVDIYQRDVTVFKKYDKTISGAAVFHQSTLDDFLVENLSLTAGIRFDFEQDILDYTYDILRSGNMVNMADTTYPDLTYMEILPKIAANYKLNRSSIYAVVAKGYKTGGFNSTFYKDEDLFFDPEFSWSYEAGFKSVLFNSFLYTDISLFYIDWKNQQIYQPAFYKDNTPAPGSLLKNAGKSVSKGGEISIKTAAIKGFIPALSYGFTHAVFTEHKVDNETDHTGNYIPYIPKHTVNVIVKRYFRMNGINFLDKIGFNAMYRGLGDIYWNEENSFKTGFYGLLDAKISFHKNNMGLEFWGKNLLGTEYDAFYFQALGNQYVQTGKPLCFGLNLRYEF